MFPGLAKSMDSCIYILCLGALERMTAPDIFLLLHYVVLIINPISTGLFYLVVALGGPHPTSIKFDPEILEHGNVDKW